MSKHDPTNTHSSTSKTQYWHHGEPWKARAALRELSRRQQPVLQGLQARSGKRLSFQVFWSSVSHSVVL